MTPRSLARWELRRKGGFLHFVLMWGVVRFGSFFLALGVAESSFSNWMFNRKMARARIPIELRLADLVPYLPQLLVLFFGGGALLAVALWYHMESAYRRAQSSARA